MKKSYCATLRFCICIVFTHLLVGLNTINAQWVPIQPAFATYISTYITPTAVNGNMLDTTSTAIVSLKNLTMISDTTITDISGIQYFDSLINLKVRSTKLLYVPLLPAGLKTAEFIQAGSQLVTPLPSGLSSLILQYNKYTAFPLLPSTLQKLELLYFDSVAVLPALPAGLTHLVINRTKTGTVIPAIPTAVKYLDLSYTEYGPINSWPVTPNYFYCNTCPNITALPNLPANMHTLSVNSCNISTMGTVNNVMQYLDLSSNPLGNINLPDTVIYSLYLDTLVTPGLLNNIQHVAIGGRLSVNYTANSNISQLLSRIRPRSINSILQIDASSCQMASIPQLNFQCSWFNVSHNPITLIVNQNYFAIDSSGSTWQYYRPFGNGVYYDFSYCGLTSIPCNLLHFASIDPIGSSINLSNNNLTTINCNVASSRSGVYYYNNQITNFTIPVKGGSVNLDNNQITCLPYLAAGLRYLSLNNNPINCIPNIPDTNFVCHPALNICQPGNSNNCPALNLTGGRIYSDANQNAIRDNGEVLLPDHNVLLLPDDMLHRSDGNGKYTFNVLANQTYQIRGLSTYPYRYVTSPQFNVSYNQLGLTDTSRNIGVYVQPDVNDLIVRITPYKEARPGFHHYYDVTLRNEGTTVQNGSLVMYFDPALFYQSSSPAGTVSGNRIIWPITSLDPLESFSARLNFIIPATVNLGSIIPAGAYALGNLPDTTIADNHDTIQQIAVGSYDPNDKQAIPAEGFTVQHLQSGPEYIEYVVRFQNTGTASAINVRVEDTISTFLDITTFELMAASHSYRYSIENRVLKVYFDNIYLPDSGSNEELSHGFFRYRIRTAPNLVAGNNIHNTAHIYFDFNPPIITNTVTNGILSEFAVDPFSQQLCTGERLLLYAKATRPVISKQWFKNGLPTGITSDTLYIDSVTAADNGDYALHIVVETGTFISRVATVYVFDVLANNLSFKISGTRLTMGNDTLYQCTNNNSALNTQHYYVTSEVNMPYSTIYVWYINGIVRGYGKSLNLNIQWHTGDRLTCVAQTPCSALPVSASSYALVTSTGPTMKIEITPNLAHICPVQNITFYANVLHGDENVYWSRNGIVSNTTGLSRFYTSVTSSDVIVAFTTPIDDGGCPTTTNGGLAMFDTAQIIIDTNAHGPTPTILTFLSQLPFCQGFQNKVTATGDNHGTNAEYQWYVNGQPTGNATNQLLDTFYNGDIVQWRLIRHYCAEDTFLSPPLVLHEDSMAASVKIIVTSSDCGYNTSLSRQIQNVNSYQTLWKINGVPAGNSSNYSLQRTEGRADTIQLAMYIFGCAADTLYADTILQPYFKQHRQVLPPTPNATEVCANQTVNLWNSNAFHANWYKNGDSLASNTLFVNISDSASFTVTLTTVENNCYYADTSLPVTIQIADSLTATVNMYSIPAVYCDDQGAVFSFTTNAPQYYRSWSSTSTGYVGNSSNTYVIPSVNEGDIIQLSVTPLGGCYTNSTVRDTIVVHLATQTPAINITAAVPGLCDGNTINLFTVDGFYLGSNPHYQWIKNNVPVGSNSYQYGDSALNNGDKVYCMVTSNNPCITTSVALSDTLSMVASTTVTPSININTADNSVCQNQPALFTTQTTNAGSTPGYQWLVNNNITNASGPSFSGVLNDGDAVSCILTSSEVCLTQPAATSNSIIVVVYPLPDTPTISRTGMTLTSSTTNNQWLLNDNAIIGAVSNTYAVTQSGWYSVQTTDNNGCTSTATPVYVDVTGIAAESIQPEILIYPNPAHHVLYIQTSTGMLNSIIEIHDAYGRLVLSDKLQSVKQSLSTEKLSRGMYFVSIKGTTTKAKVVLQ